MTAREDVVQAVAYAMDRYANDRERTRPSSWHGYAEAAVDAAWPLIADIVRGGAE